MPLIFEGKKDTTSPCKYCDKVLVGILQHEKESSWTMWADEMGILLQEAGKRKKAELEQQKKRNESREGIIRITKIKDQQNGKVVRKEVRSIGERD